MCTGREPASSFLDGIFDCFYLLCHLVLVSIIPTRLSRSYIQWDTSTIPPRLGWPVTMAMDNRKPNILGLLPLSQARSFSTLYPRSVILSYQSDLDNLLYPMQSRKHSTRVPTLTALQPKACSSTCAAPFNQSLITNDDSDTRYRDDWSSIKSPPKPRTRKTDFVTKWR